jgi:hypothetical protein
VLRAASCGMTAVENRRCHEATGVFHLHKGSMGGRPEFKPTPAQRRLVKDCKGFGLRHEDIRQLVINPTTDAPVDHLTLEKHFRCELDEGAIRANAAVAKSLYQQATGGGDWRKANITASIWWSKCRMHWRSRPGRWSTAAPRGPRSRCSR